MCQINNFSKIRTENSIYVSKAAVNFPERFPVVVYEGGVTFPGPAI